MMDSFMLPQPIKMQESRMSHVGLSFVSVDRLAKQPVENKK
jgi:hypothetical protein